MSNTHMVLVDVPAQSGLPSVRLERSSAGKFTLHVNQSTHEITPASTLVLQPSESGWGPVISCEVTVTLLSAGSEPMKLGTWWDHDVFDPDLIAPLVAALQQVSAAVGCPLQVQDIIWSQG